MKYILSKEQIIQDTIKLNESEKLELISNAEALFDFYVRKKKETIDYRILRED